MGCSNTALTLMLGLHSWVSVRDRERRDGGGQQLTIARNFFVLCLSLRFRGVDRCLSVFCPSQVDVTLQVEGLRRSVVGRSPRSARLRRRRCVLSVALLSVFPFVGG